MVHIARSSQANTSTSFLSENSTPGEDRAQLIADGSGNPLLRLNLEFDRAWNSVERALESAQFKITETNETFSQYEIEYLVDESGDIDLPDDNAEPGFFEKLFVQMIRKSLMLSLINSLLN